jgi:hypothetical protein
MMNRGRCDVYLRRRRCCDSGRQQPGRERPRTDAGVRVRGPEVGSLTSRLLSYADRSRGKERRAVSFRHRTDDCPQPKRAAGEILKACSSDRRLWTTVIEANR